MDNYIELGNISGFFGVKGWVKLYSHSRPRIGIAKYQHFYLGEKKNAIVFTQIKKSGKNIVAHIKNVDSKEAAVGYVGQSLFVLQQDLPELENEYYWHELLGLKVINQKEIVLGKITEMMETGTNDVIAIKNDNGEEILIPYATSHFILAVDIEKGEMRVNWELDDN